MFTMNAAYTDFAVDLAVNTTAIFLLAYALYFRRHRRADLLLRYRAGTRPAEVRTDERRTEVTLDVVHSDDAALVADLERRLGGQVLRHEVKDIDYVRDIMVVDVRFRPWVRRPEYRLEQPVAGG